MSHSRFFTIAEHIARPLIASTICAATNLAMIHASRSAVAMPSQKAKLLDVDKTAATVSSSAKNAKEFK